MDELLVVGRLRGDEIPGVSNDEVHQKLQLVVEMP
jgi:ATP-dependent Zn protease